MSFCPGDGSGAQCPCGNSGGPGEGCANSTGAGGRLSASGSQSAGADHLAFSAASLPPGQPALLFTADNALGGGQGLLLGDGLRCVGGNAVRLGIVTADGAGQATYGPGLGALGGWTAGTLRRFQVWYRDPGGPCGSGFNLTHGLAVEFGV